jgi:hypothetical protein
MDIQKVASTGTAAVVLGTGAVPVDATFCMSIRLVPLAQIN